MISLGPLSFAVPLALAGLLALPALWWLLRAIPPRPRQLRFPPLRLLAGLASSEQSVERTPPWLLVLRLVLATALILGVAQPLWNAGKPLPGSGPLVLIVDDGWAAGADWPARQTVMADLVDRADREGRRIILVSTAPAPGLAEPPPPRLLTASEARDRIAALAPHPWETRRDVAIAALRALPALESMPPGTVVWLSDGLRGGEDGTVAGLVRSLRALGPVRLVLPDPGAAAKVLRVSAVSGETLKVNVAQAGAGTLDAVVQAVDENGRIVARALAVSSDGDAGSPAAELILPAELRNRVARVELASGRTAGSVVLLDARWQRRPVGIAASPGIGAELPLLSPSYYLERALEAGSEVRRGEVAALLDRDLSILIVPDDGITDGISDPGLHRRIDQWVRDGGILLRFAGPGLAMRGNRDDELLPVPLRAGERIHGGAMAWREPARLAPFPAAGPFAGLNLPPDVAIFRQVLAEPALAGPASVWAELDDGTPLVTSRGHAQGRLVLFHVSADPDWSSLPLSGLFVEMLDRIIDLGRGGTGVAGDGPPLAPIRTLDGFGDLGPAPPSARAIPASLFAESAAGSQHPPGLYGSRDRRQALNLPDTLPDPKAIEALPRGVEVAGYAPVPEIDFRPWLLGLALTLIVIDLAASLALRGLLPVGRRSRMPRTAGSVVLVFAVATAAPAWAQQAIADGTAVPEALVTSLAYVDTGNAERDAISRRGLAGLTAIVNRRTAVELGEPVRIDLATDELIFYPFIYWPLSADATMPSDAALRRLRAYMASGGTVLVDTGAGRRGDTPAADLRHLARALDLPPLAPVPEDHVLGRAYYLLSAFPGRFAGGQVWVERSGDRLHDGVSGIVAGGNDWASAWALDANLRPMFAVVPGGERQREMAYRFGVNLVMYVLTGNYKADQVHLPAILERLGR
ncbi:MAG: DUF4159 domain-containing protein [Rhodospirillales bacterium]|nr:MAG: DUF4159 domain-containing protein [Rhodospirillales bacterium]